MSPALVNGGTSAPRNSAQIESDLKLLVSSVKKSSLEPPLTEADFNPEILARIKPASLPPNEFYKLSLETACKGLIFEIATKGTPDNSEILIAFCNLLDIALFCSEQEISDTGLPLTLIEELFDSQTIPSCDILFQYLESRIERITKGMGGGKGKALVLLRLCNELLRRLSKTEDTIFCGRILIFLSKSFPIGERSGVNLRGDFNVENVTVFDKPIALAAPEEMEIDNTEGEKGESAEGESKAEDDGKGVKAVSFKKQAGPSMDTNSLYPIFWSLQNDFANPTRLFVPQNFEIFKKGLASTMSKFKQADENTVKSTGGSNKVEGGTNGVKKTEETKIATVFAGEKRKREEVEEETKGEGFNPKYLTSPELFELEISDLTFRRHVLVQSMILIDFLLSLTPAAKEKWKDLQTPNRPVQYAFTLSLEDEQWALKTRTQISTSLQPDQLGRLFMRLINTVLTREQNWVRWKLEGCHPFDKPPLPEAEFEDAKKKASDHCIKDRPFPYIMGTPNLSRLWKSTGVEVGLECLKNVDRHSIPTPESFRADIKQNEEDIKDALFPNQVEEAQNAKSTKLWKALRIASKDRFHLFNKLDDSKPEEVKNDLEMFFDAEDKLKEETKAKVNIQTTSKPPGKSPEAAKADQMEIEKPTATA